MSAGAGGRDRPSILGPADVPDSTGLPFVPADEVRRRIGPDDARRLVERALADGFDPADDPARSSVAAGPGHLLLMPSVLGDWAGV